MLIPFLIHGGFTPPCALYLSVFTLPMLLHQSHSALPYISNGFLSFPRNLTIHICLLRDILKYHLRRFLDTNRRINHQIVISAISLPFTGNMPVIGTSGLVRTLDILLCFSYETDCTCRHRDKTKPNGSSQRLFTAVNVSCRIIKADDQHNTCLHGIQRNKEKGLPFIIQS